MFLTKEVSEDITNYNSNKAVAVLSENTFSKSERLHQDIIIASLFATGQIFYINPFKVYFIHTEKSNSAAPVRVIISVPKKTFQSAVNRNKIKRQIRESYRKNKHALCKILIDKKHELAIAFIYTSKKITTFNEVESKIKITLNRLIQEVEKNAQNF